MAELEENIVVTLCKLEMIFPPGFFDCMEHLVVVHLAPLSIWLELVVLSHFVGCTRSQISPAYTRFSKVVLYKKTKLRQISNVGAYKTLGQEVVKKRIDCLDRRDINLLCHVLFGGYKKQSSRSKSC